MKRAAVLVGALAVAACGAEPPRAAAPLPSAASATAAAGPPAGAADDFRASPPGPSGPLTWSPPAIEEARLANGVRVLVLPRHDLPVVAVVLSVTPGAEASTKPGLATFASAAAMLGARGRSAAAISDEVQRLGAQMHTGADYDGATLSLQVLAPRLARALDLAADVWTAPTFPKDEIDKARSRRLTALAQQNDSPREIATRALLPALYPAGHPYASPLAGTVESTGGLTAADCARWHAAAVRPDRTTVAFAGDVTKARAVAEAERVLGGFRAKGPPAPATPPLDQAEPAGEPALALVDRPGMTQSVLLIARPGVPRRTPDHEAIVVANTILGGQFSSRLNLNLREKHAYAYGAGSSFDTRHGPGPFVASANVVREKTGPALAEALAEIARMRAAAPGEEELEAAKARLVRATPAQFETSGAAAWTMTALAVQGLPLDEPAQRLARIAKVTSEDVLRVARARWPEGGFRIVVVGDAKMVEPQLAALPGAPRIVRREVAEVMK